MLRRWGNETRRFGIIEVGNGEIANRKEIKKLTVCDGFASFTALRRSAVLLQ